jgi:urease accessory protein
MKKQFILLSLLLGIATPVLAHTGVGTTHDFMAGFSHPWQGIDHMLVMVTIGFWASVLGGKARGLLPLSFLLLMAAGAGLGFAGISIPYAELGVASSVLLAGLAIGFNWRPSTAVAMGLVAVFAVFHGYVHAAETLSGTNQGAYALGFLLTTALLHGLGLGIGLFGEQTVKVLRMSLGVVATVVGVLLLAS